MINIHISWVGPPQTYSADDIKSDLYGIVGKPNIMKSINTIYHTATVIPLLAYVQQHPNQYQITFWCLQRYVEHYQTLLADLDIAVMAC